MSFAIKNASFSSRPTNAGSIQNKNIQQGIPDNNDILVFDSSLNMWIYQANTTGPVSSGTEAAPSYTFIGDTDTGMFRPESNTIGFTTGGTERLRIANDETTASVPLSVSDNTNSTSSTTGSIVTEGGIGIAQDIFVGGQITTTNTATEDVDGVLEFRIGDETILQMFSDQLYMPTNVYLDNQFSLNNKISTSITEAFGFQFSCENFDFEDDESPADSSRAFIYNNAFQGGTLSALNTNVTVDDVATIFVSQPAQSTNIVFTNVYSIINEGNMRIDGFFEILNSVAPGTTTNRLYAVGGELFWNGVQIS
jgi:hypothetical protein